MLKTNKTINFTGTSEVNGRHIMSFSANIGEYFNINCSIMDRAGYEENKAVAQADQKKFTEEAYKLQDEWFADDDTTVIEDATTTA